MWRATSNLFVTIAFAILLRAAQTFSVRRSCNAGTECIIIQSCPVMVRLVESGDPANIGLVRQAICGFQGRRSLVCCPSKTNPVIRTNVSVLILGVSNDNLLPGPGLCGRPRVDDKIFGGAPTPLGGYPWMAAMGYTEPGKKNVAFICAGSIINSRYILTAAHCVAEKDLGRKRLSIIHLGDWDLDNPGKDCQITRLGTQCIQPRIVAGFEKIIIHPLYDTRGRSSDDIALIRLNINIEFDTVKASVEPVCLPGKNLEVRSLVDKKEAIATGWGLTEHGNHSNIMLRVNVPVVSNELCKERYIDYIVGEQICVGGKEGFDTCTGDSGGPLIIPEKEGPPFTQIGVVSYGPFPCGLDKFPGVYTSVQNYIEWIKTNLQP